MLIDASIMRCGVIPEDHPEGVVRPGMIELPDTYMPAAPPQIVAGMNDKYSDCVQTMVCNAIAGEMAAAGDLTPIPNGVPVDLYEMTTGFRRDDPSTDRGTLVSAMWAWWKAKPIAGYLLDDAESLALDEYTIRHAIMTQRGCALIVNLTGLQTMAAPWMGVGAPNFRGQHAIWARSWQKRFTDVDTWGILEPVDRSFLASPYLVAAYALKLKKV